MPRTRRLRTQRRVGDQRVARRGLTERGEPRLELAVQQQRKRTRVRRWRERDRARRLVVDRPQAEKRRVGPRPLAANQRTLEGAERLERACDVGGGRLRRSRVDEQVIGVLRIGGLEQPRGAEGGRGVARPAESAKGKTLER